MGSRNISRAICQWIPYGFQGELHTLPMNPLDRTPMHSLCTSKAIGPQIPFEFQGHTMDSPWISIEVFSTVSSQTVPGNIPMHALWGSKTLSPNTS